MIFPLGYVLIVLAFRIIGIKGNYERGGKFRANITEKSVSTNKIHKHFQENIPVVDNIKKESMPQPDYENSFLFDEHLGGEKQTISNLNSKHTLEEKTNSVQKNTDLPAKNNSSSIIDHKNGTYFSKNDEETLSPDLNDNIEEALGIHLYDEKNLVIPNQPEPSPDLLDNLGVTGGQDILPHYPDFLDSIDPESEVIASSDFCESLKDVRNEEIRHQESLGIPQDGFVFDSGFVLTRSRIMETLNEAIDRVEKLRNSHLQTLMPQFSIILNNNTDYVLNILKVQYGYAASIASDMLKDLIGGEVSKDELVTVLRSINFEGTDLGRLCPFRYTQQNRVCQLGPYRQIDGYCNNLRNPFWGASGSPVQRFLKADFGDGINAPRRSFDGGELPNARLVSTTVLHTDVRDHNRFTHILMTFGQFLDHEFALGSSPTGFEMGDIKCCRPENKDHPQCFAVQIPENDYFFSRYNSTCMEVVRSVPAVTVNCHLGPRQTLNEITSYIDGSQVYGSTAETQNRLREFRGGLLKSQPNPTNPKLQRLLPVTAKPSSEACAKITGKFKCFASGDKRTNENSLLMTVHTIFMREHNRIASTLAKLNPQWDDERIYEEAKRIVGATIQHISYSEYLPLIIGQAQIERFNLNLMRAENTSADPVGRSRDQDLKHFVGYCDAVDATVDQGFITAAFRFGHSLINREMFRMTKLQLSYSLIRLKNDFFHPIHIYKDHFPQGIDPLIRGLVHQSAQRMDTNVAEDVKNHLFQLDNENFGMDLMVLNIMRAREHGVPGYNVWRSWCGYNRFHTWSDMKGYALPQAIKDMRLVYKHPDDIDLFVGGLSEKAARGGSLVGPTLSCIIGNQFKRFRFGDRYWYENGNVPGLIEHAFTIDQLRELKKVTLSRLFCDNSDTIQSIQVNPFKRSSQNNPIQACIEFPSINLTFWKDEQ